MIGEAETPAMNADAARMAVNDCMLMVGRRKVIKDWEIYLRVLMTG
jgi:hypothetical protein